MELFTVSTSSEGVKHLQQRLQEFGFYQGEITGNFDEATEAAVKALQEAEGLAADGVVGLMTLYALDLVELGMIEVS